MDTWAISGSYIAHMIKEDWRDGSKDGKLLPHHEANDTFEKRFLKHRESLRKSFEKFGNPFHPSHDNLLQIVSKQVMSQTAADSVLSALVTGEEQIRTIMLERVCGDILSLYSTRREQNKRDDDARTS